MFSNQRLGADDQYRLEIIVACLQFAENQARFDGFTNTNAICNEDTWAFRVDHLQSRAELIRHKVYTRCIQRVQLVIGGAAKLLSCEQNF